MIRNYKHYFTETFKDIPGFENRYQVSNLGNVKSLERLDGLGRLKKEQLLKQQKDKYGYLQVALCKNGKMKSYTVHRLVWQAFNGPIPEGYQVNHLSEKKIQNNLDNLNLMTAKENNNWGSRNIKVAKALSKPIIQCDKQGNFIKEWSSIMEIERSLGFGHQNICSCCNGKRKFANGYKWKYKIKEIA